MGLVSASDVLVQRDGSSSSRTDFFKVGKVEIGSIKKKISNPPFVKLRYSVPLFEKEGPGEIFEPSRG
jgi:hypothetical protein